MNRALAVSAFAVACVLSGCNKTPESAPAPATAAAPAKDSTMAGEKMAADTSKMMDSTKAMTDSTKMMTDSTMQMPADSAKK
jgi:photosystem II stability/assembly factor-like uncharacterized protein